MEIANTAIYLLTIFLLFMSAKKIKLSYAIKNLTNSIYNGIAIITDKYLSDEKKEIQLKSLSKSIIKEKAKILFLLFIIVAVSSIPFWIAYSTNLTTIPEFKEYIMSWQAIIIGTILFTLYIFKKNKEEEKGKIYYSSGEKIFHMLAFTKIIQNASLHLDRIPSFFKKIKPNDNPIFITSLARGGTTALLNALQDTGCFSSNIYRDMPFIMAPTLWKPFSLLLKNDQSKPRLHGDGLSIDLDKPEAFEEVIWKYISPEKYNKSNIETWNKENLNKEQIKHLSIFFAKVIKIRGGSHKRYLSKNNANISRITALKNAFPKSDIIVVVRHPIAHANSLLRQHINFTKIQKKDKFIQRYMEDIGHYEFGLSHKPILFDNFNQEKYKTEDGDYWLNYWICAFSQILDEKQDIKIVFQDDLRSQPDIEIKKILSYIKIPTNPNKKENYRNFFISNPDHLDCNKFSEHLIKKSIIIYEELKKRQKQKNQ